MISLFKKIKDIIFKIRDYDRLELDYCSVLDYVTKSRMSKPNYVLKTIFDVIDEVREEEKNSLWYNAEDELYLPEYEREVIVLTQCFPDDAGIFRVSFAHRPHPNGWYGRNIDTGEVEHYEAIKYGKGGWNIPDVVYWLDLELPINEEEIF